MAESRADRSSLLVNLPAAGRKASRPALTRCSTFFSKLMRRDSYRCSESFKTTHRSSTQVASFDFCRLFCSAFQAFVAFLTGLPASAPQGGIRTFAAERDRGAPRGQVPLANVKWDDAAEG
jgi:hypothetical protein